MATTVSAVIRRGDEVLLVRQRNHESAGDAWFLPGGVVEGGEHLHEATRREVLEETGLQVDGPTRLAYISHTVVRLGPDEVASGQSFVFEVADPGGEPFANDPDGDVTDVEFCPLEEAISRIGLLPWDRMRRPAVAHLDGSTLEGAVWLWEYGADGEDACIGIIGGTR